ncbi:MAG: aldo/keto reductase [Clostridiales bacterium]|nr:aldo/keto reductase [Clostridiales bacterium]
MKKIMLGNNRKLLAPALAVGCMRISEMEENKLISHIEGCMEMGLNFFDHADIYGGGSCEKQFGEAVKKAGIRREDMILQSKCGIVPGRMYDFSKDYIVASTEGILKRLQTDYLDILLLHRPDALCEPEEVAAAFDVLERTGKVRYFGVSNHNPYQIELLKKSVKQELIIDQLQFSIPFSNMIASGMEVNMLTEGAVDRDGHVLDYCRLNDITVQAWSPFQYGFFEGNFIGNKEKFPELNAEIDRQAEKYGVTPTGIATAWILRHPAKVQMIAGSTKLQRLKEMDAGSEIDMTREDWYRLYLASGHILP